MLIRITTFALFLAIMIPLGWAIKAGVAEMSADWKHLILAGIVGFSFCYALWAWDDRQQRRQRSESRGDWD